MFIITHQLPLTKQFVVAKSLNGEYITKRKGMDYTQVDYEEGQQEKNAKSSQEDDGDLTEAIRRYESRLSAFKKVILWPAKRNYIPF